MSMLRWRAGEAALMCRAQQIAEMEQQTDILKLEKELERCVTCRLVCGVRMVCR